MWPRWGTPIWKWRGCSSSRFRVQMADFGLTEGVWDGKLLYLSIQVSLSTVHKEIYKMPWHWPQRTLPWGVTLSLSHTYIGLPYGLNFRRAFPALLYGSLPRGMWLTGIFCSWAFIKPLHALLKFFNNFTAAVSLKFRSGAICSIQVHYYHDYTSTTKYRRKRLKINLETKRQGQE